MPDFSTLTPADGWTLTTGSLAGKPIAGRIYTITVHHTSTGDGATIEDLNPIIHVTILSGRAHDFPICP